MANREHKTEDLVPGIEDHLRGVDDKIVKGDEADLQQEIQWIKTGMETDIKQTMENVAMAIRHLLQRTEDGLSQLDRLYKKSSITGSANVELTRQEMLNFMVDQLFEGFDQEKDVKVRFDTVEVFAKLAEKMKKKAMPGVLISNGDTNGANLEGPSTGLTGQSGAASRPLGRLRPRTRQGRFASVQRECD